MTSCHTGRAQRWPVAAGQNHADAHNNAAETYTGRVGICTLQSLGQKHLLLCDPPVS